MARCLAIIIYNVSARQLMKKTQRKVFEAPTVLLVGYLS